MASTRFRPVRTRGSKRSTPQRIRTIYLPSFRPLVSITLALFAILGLAFYWLDVKVRPVMTVAARAIATRVATDALNEAVTAQIAHDADYSRIVEIDTGPDGHLQVARFNFASVTELQVAATHRAQVNLQALSADSLPLPLGQILAGPIVGRAGPQLSMHLYLVGSAHSSVTTDVKSVGVNQTVHILYLDLTAQVNVVAPLLSSPVTVQSHIPLAYVVLSGTVPNTYLNGGSGPSGLPIVPITPSKN